MTLRMDGLLILLIALAGCAPFHAPSPTPDRTPGAPGEGYAMVWEDSFDQPDGSAPDPKKWNYSVGGSGWGNGELQCYTDRIANSHIDQGMLVLQAEREDYMGCKYTSARLNTLAKGEWKFGLFTVRAKLPSTQGIWPAIWLLPSNITRYGNWPASGEIDIMELVGKEPGRVTGTLHFGNPHRSITAPYDLPDGAGFSDDFHIFALEWTPDRISWYVDGHQYQTADQWVPPGNYSFPAPFDVPFYLILNVAVGGNFPGTPDASSVFPQRMYVDYVRIYQLMDPAQAR